MANDTSFFYTIKYGDIFVVLAIAWQLYGTVLPVKSDSDDMFCLQSYQGLVIDKSPVY